MADISVTPASVIPGANAIIERGYLAGAALVAGDVAYLDATTSTWKLADANGNETTSPGISSIGGIVLHTAAAGQPVAVQTGGSITLGSVLTAAKAYVLSANPGKIAPIADLTTGWKTSHLGTASTTSVLAMKINNTGVTN